jgi:hypothetical protein
MFGIRKIFGFFSGMWGAHASTSPLELGHPSYVPDNNILADWNRLRDMVVIIDGVELNDLLGNPPPDVPYFDNTKELKDFFKAHLIPGFELEGTAEEIKKKSDALLAQLMLSMHQGALLHPATVASAFYFSKNSPLILGQGEGDQDRAISLITNSSGFTIQEIVTQKLIKNPDDYHSSIVSDDGKEFVFRALIKLKVKLDPTETHPSVIGYETEIDYGSKVIQEMMDKRSPFAAALDLVYKGPLSLEQQAFKLVDREQADDAEGLENPEASNVKP